MPVKVAFVIEIAVAEYNLTKVGVLRDEKTAKNSICNSHGRDVGRSLPKRAWNGRTLGHVEQFAKLEERGAA
jgi:hypothetical protein